MQCHTLVRGGSRAKKEGVHLKGLRTKRGEKVTNMYKRFIYSFIVNLLCIALWSCDCLIRVTALLGYFDLSAQFFWEGAHLLPVHPPESAPGSNSTFCGKSSQKALTLLPHPYLHAQKHAITNTMAMWKVIILIFWASSLHYTTSLIYQNIGIDRILINCSLVYTTLLCTYMWLDLWRGLIAIPIAHTVFGNP